MDDGATVNFTYDTRSACNQRTMPLCLVNLWRWSVIASVRASWS